MALFRRRKAAETVDEGRVPVDDERDEMGATSDKSDDAVADDGDDVVGDDAEDGVGEDAQDMVGDDVDDPTPTTPAPPFDRANGPFDVTECDDQDRLDLGALQLIPIEGMGIHLEVDEATSAIVAVTATHRDSAMQLTAFAAPRSEGLWEAIRGELVSAVTKAGGTTEVVDGPLGRELRVRRPASGPGGRTVFAPSRFVGVDGPRWFLRGVLSGRAAIDEAAAEPLLQLFRTTVVVRGGDPMGPREMLSIIVPAGPPDEAADDPEAPPMNPLERGPEITQVG